MIVLYKGVSAFSKLIKFLNWSDYSHTAWQDPEDHTCWHAVAGSGVSQSKDISETHTDGTPIELYYMDYTPPQLKAMREFAKAQLGKPYDWPGAFNFITRPKDYRGNMEKWFCSGFVFALHQAAGIDLLKRVPYWKVTPAMICYSPLLLGPQLSLTRKSRTFSIAK